MAGLSILQFSPCLSHTLNLADRKIRQEGNSKPPYFPVFSPQLAGLSWYEPFMWQKDSPPRRVPRASRKGVPGRQVALSSM